MSTAKNSWVSKYGLSFAACLGIWATFAPDAVASSINPALASLATAFPDVSYSMIAMVSTLPSLFVVIATLAVGPFIGKQLRYKQVALVGFVIALVAGVAPTFTNSFYVILASRCLFGIAIGILAPIGPAVTMASFKEGPARSNMLAVGNAILNVFAIATTLMAGVLASVFWKYTFLIYMINVVPIVLIALFMKEPPRQEAPVEEKKEKAPSKALPGIVIFDCMVFFVMIANLALATINTSSVVMEFGLDTAAVVGVVMLGQSFGSLIGNIAFPVILKKAKRFTVAAGLLIGACASLTWCTVGPHSLAGLFVGLFLNGFALNLVIPSFQNEISNECAPEQTGFASSLFMACMNLGSFASGLLISFWMDFLGIQSFITPVMFGIVIWLALALAVTLIQWKRPNPPTEWSEDPAQA